jgi:membrane protein
VVAGRGGHPARADRAVAYVAATLPGRCLRRFHDIDGRDRALAVAGQAFTTLIPLLIVSAALAPDDAVARRLVERFRLSGGAAEAVRLLFSRPPGTTGTITIVGGVVLFYSTLSFTRALQRLWEAAWELPGAGVRGTLHALTGFTLLLTQIIALALLANAFGGWPGADVLGVALSVVVAAGLWLQLQYLLLSRRVPRARLVPGAVLAGAGQAVVSLYSAVWMPRLISTNAERYGVIGVTFALLTWLIVIAFCMVCAAVVSAEIGLSGEPSSAPADEPSEPDAAANRTSPAHPAPRPARFPGVRARLAALARADRTDRFGVVLLLVVATVLWTEAAPATWWARLLVLALQTATLVGALRAALAGSRMLAVVAGLWSAGALVAVLAAVAGADPLGLTAALAVLLLSAALVAVLRRLVRQPAVSPSTVAGAISAYLLLGLVFSWTYALMAAAGAQPLSGTDPDARLNVYLYFAFTTLTTTGFGDISPVTDGGRAVAILEALLGQLYLVTVLALVIGNMRPRRAR